MIIKYREVINHENERIDVYYLFDKKCFVVTYYRQRNNRNNRSMSLYNTKIK